MAAGVHLKSSESPEESHDHHTSPFGQYESHRIKNGPRRSAMHLKGEVGGAHIGGECEGREMWRVVVPGFAERKTPPTPPARGEGPRTPRGEYISGLKADDARLKPIPEKLLFKKSSEQNLPRAPLPTPRLARCALRCSLPLAGATRVIRWLFPVC